MEKSCLQFYYSYFPDLKMGFYMVSKSTDILLVGSGAMSSTLGVILKQLDPLLTITMVERLDDVSQESTHGWNNAGTGHAAYCELNYTPQGADGCINAAKAYDINEQFETSLQLWAYLVQEKALPSPEMFINPTPHVSFVWGEANVEFLRKRYDVLKQHHFFSDMEFSDDPEVLAEWMPLVMQGRSSTEKVAATRIQYGTDVNFASLSRNMIAYLKQLDNFDLLLNQEVKHLSQAADKCWQVTVQNRQSGEKTEINAGFVFLGAGGAALSLLQKSGIPESKGYGGFPVSGQWLVCKNQQVVKQHLAKVYGKASIGAPPMSVPHLDTRVVDGEKALLFGPFAGFTTKFLKHGSILDLFASIHPNNLWPMLKVGLGSFDLIRYLISEVLQTRKARMKSLREYFPNARDQDWSIQVAGQRVQIIKKCEQKGGRLEFGTEVVASSDGTLATLLGASPGASVTVTAMLEIIEKCFPEKMQKNGWKEKISEVIPSYGKSLKDDVELSKKIKHSTLTTLKLLD